MKVLQREIAEHIKKTTSAVCYVKKNNPREYEIMELGTAAKKLGLTLEELQKIHDLKQALKDAA